MSVYVCISLLLPATRHLTAWLTTVWLRDSGPDCGEEDNGKQHGRTTSLITSVQPRGQSPTFYFSFCCECCCWVEGDGGEEVGVGNDCGGGGGAGV